VSAIHDASLTKPLERATRPPAAWHYEDVAAAILRHFDPRTATGPFQVLEAGGGSLTHLPLPPSAEITTIDISAEQLAENTYATEKLQGDLQTFDYGDRRFDLVIAWDVLEHLSRPEAALERFASVLKPGGHVLVVGPLHLTLKGLVTRLTPHWLHVQFYRHVLRSPVAGLPGHPPFETELAGGADWHEVAHLLTARGMTVTAIKGYESSHVAALRQKSRALIGLYRLAERALALATTDRFERGMTDFFLIAQKPH
jgi:SAM-dependent methyltransferase